MQSRGCPWPSSGAARSLSEQSGRRPQPLGKSRSRSAGGESFPGGCCRIRTGAAVSAWHPPLLYVDATLVKADTCLDSLVSRPLYRQLPEVDSYVSEVWAQNPAEPEGEGPPPTGSGAGSAGEAPANERRVSRTDPQAAIISDRKKGLFLAHKVHVAVDGGPARIITGLIVTPGDRPEAHQLVPLLGQHFWLVDRAPDEVIADRGYSINSVYQLLQRDSILPSIPRRSPWRTTASGRKFELGFTYVPSVDRYRCPKGKWLYRLDVPYNGLIRYRTHRYACRQCELKPRCTRGEQCTISQPVDGGTRRWVDDHLRTWRARHSIRLRPCWVETVMADLKNNPGLGRARLRGTKFEVQALLAAVAHNAKQLAISRQMATAVRFGRLSVVVSLSASLSRC